MLMTSKNYGWQKRWALDRATGLGRHDSGLVFGSGGTLHLDLTPADKLAEFQRQHGGHNTPIKLQRLSREVQALFATQDPRDARL